jgi:hypothetical protein
MHLSADRIGHRFVGVAALALFFHMALHAVSSVRAAIKERAGHGSILRNTKDLPRERDNRLRNRLYYSAWHFPSLDTTLRLRLKVLRADEAEAYASGSSSEDH